MTTFVSTIPELVEDAAGELASIRSTLGQATAAAAGPTTALQAAAADEISVAISQLFGSYGYEFQALSAQAGSFHTEFVSLLNGGAAAYLDTEMANAAQGLQSAAQAPGAAAASVLSGIVGGGTGNVLSNRTSLQSVLGGLLPGLGSAGTGAAATAVNPWMALFDNTSTNLGLIQANFAAHPFPLLHQILSNQQGYWQLVDRAFVDGVNNFPGGLQYVPAQIEAAVGSALSGNPAVVVQQYFTNQASYAQLVATSLGKAGQDFQTTIPVFESDMGNTEHALVTGNFNGAVQDFSHGLLDLFVSGFDTSHLGVTLSPLGIAGPIYVDGPGGDLLPILSIPGMEQQFFTNLLPPGSSIQHMAQNYTNIINTLTGAGISTTVAPSINLLDPGASSLGMSAYFGVPLQLAFAVLGPPVNAANSMASVGALLANDIQTANPLAFATDLFDAPAIVANGYLNGTTIIDLNMTVSESLAGLAVTIPVTLHLPFDGLLVPPTDVTATANLDVLGVFDVPLNLTVGGTQLGGLAPLLVNGIPEALAASITNT